MRQQWLGTISMIGCAALWPSSGRLKRPRRPYPTMAPSGQYQMDRAAEIALARARRPPPSPTARRSWFWARRVTKPAVKGKNGYRLRRRTRMGPTTSKPGLLEPE